MRTRALLGAMVALMTLSALAVAQEKAAPPADPQMQAMMQLMEKFGTPGPEHQRLLKGVGTWDVVSKMWMDPAREPTVSKGTQVQRAILGGRYIQYDLEGDMAGMPFSGFGITGYDRYNKKVVSLWLDSMGTGFYLTEGSCDEAGQVCTETGSWDDYMTGKKMNVRDVVRHLDDDHFTMEMYTGGPDGKDVKMMEATYTRRK